MTPTESHLEKYDRRWDPCIWQDREGCHMIYLATDYRRHNPGGQWWQDYNVLCYARGERFDGSMEVVEEWEPPPGVIWTAPSVIIHEGKPLVIAGVNKDGINPDQRLCFFRINDPHKPLGHPPEPPIQYAFRNSHAWRDAQILRISENRYWLYVSTGGFRWGGAPNIILFEAEDPLGKWHCLGPIVDPSVAVLYAEFERPQLHRIDNRWVCWWSCWPPRHFATAEKDARQFVWMCAQDYETPVIHLPVVNLAGPYGLQLYRDGWCCGWVWTNPDENKGEVCTWRSQQMVADIRKSMQESMRKCRSKDSSRFKGLTGD